MQMLGKGLMILAGAINLLPVFGMLSAARVQRLYDVAFAGPDVAILLRHRALLFGIVGALLIAGALRTELRLAAVLAGLASMAGFLVFAALEGGYNEALRRVVLIDIIGIAALALGYALLTFGPARN